MALKGDKRFRFFLEGSLASSGASHFVFFTPVIQMKLSCVRKVPKSKEDGLTFMKGSRGSACWSFFQIESSTRMCLEEAIDQKIPFSFERAYLPEGFLLALDIFSLMFLRKLSLYLLASKRGSQPWQDEGSFPWSNFWSEAWRSR